uniref:Uncharacterized protein n=1 Tax=Myoviridae sp. ctLEM34 TaxID=2825082 RepID=A0A8S5TR82_9CAUD|nr:MAG TPA: hypothetical protein [Myoviridae sp. ctLEM34]DAV55201.1 MAG TPA: hypothetical protein [Caudoviricetes sp.]
MKKGLRGLLRVLFCCLYMIEIAVIKRYTWFFGSSEG